MTTKICVKCSYCRKPTDTAPDYECPNCGVIYAKAEAAIRGKPITPPQDSSKSHIHFDEMGATGSATARVAEIKKALLYGFVGATLGAAATWGAIKPTKQTAPALTLAQKQSQQPIALRQQQASNNPGQPPSVPAPTDRVKALENQVMQEIRSKLKDPDSGTFRNVKGTILERRAGSESGFTENFEEEIVCGEVNAKNSFGGFTGFSAFIWLSKGAKYDGTGKPYLWLITGDNDVDVIIRTGIQLNAKYCP